MSWISEQKLSEFIVDCQDADDGGIADRPGNMADIFHTFFGISGLSLMGYFSVTENNENNGNNIKNDLNVNDKGTSSTHYERYKEIDPTYALPRHLVEKLGLVKQVLLKV